MFNYINMFYKNIKIKIYIRIYYKELYHAIMKAEKSPGL